MTKISNPFSAVSSPANPGDVGTLIGSTIKYVFGAAGMLLLIYLVWGGLQLMLSKGEPKSIEVAKGIITNALIGFVIIILAWAIVLVLGNIFKISVFQQIF